MHSFDKNISKPNLIFIVVTTILVVVLILITVVFAGLFKVNMHKLMQEEVNLIRNNYKKPN